MNSKLNTSGAIGVFDSGVGGLTVVSRINQLLPNEKIIYFGDTAKVPYGSKSTETITRLSLDISDFLMSKNVKIIVVACNTIDATCLDEIRRHCGIPVFGVIKPGASAIANTPNIKKAGVIGTIRTIESNAHKNILKTLSPSMSVETKACPLFVPLVEEGLLNKEVTAVTIKYYLDELMQSGIDALLLACTHYAALLPAIRDYVGNITIIDPAYETAKCVKDYLLSHNIHTKEPPRHEQPIDFFLSGKTPNFSFISEQILGKAFSPEIIHKD